MSTAVWRHPTRAIWPSCAGRGVELLWPVCLAVVVYGICAFNLRGPATSAWGAPPTHASELSPFQAMAAGREAFRRGDMAGAATAWQAAARGYEVTKQPQTQSVALTLLAQAYAALGHY